MSKQYLLDAVLGRELTTTYSNAEMLKLLQIHLQENIIDQETAGAMTGALTYKNTPVKEVMTPLELTFMLNVDDNLSFETIAKVFKTGYSRIPVYEVSRVSVARIS
jgi:metal transporter CNNM